MKMKIRILLLLLASVYLSSDFVEAKSSGEPSLNNIVDKKSAVENRARKDGQMMHRVFMGLMLAKSMISMLLMFLSPILQMKGLGLTFINVIINVTRFIMQLRDRKAEPQPYKVQHVPVHHMPHYTANSEDIHDWSTSGLYAQYVQSPYNNQAAGIDWSSSNQYKSFDSTVNTDSSYFPERTVSSSWSSVPAVNELKIAEPNSAAFSNLNLENPTISHFSAQSKKIS